MELDTSVHGVTELRVHGVSGTPPEQMLDHPAELVRRVSGDRSAGCYRRWYPGGSTHDQPDRRHLEAYAWGRLTSGAASRAAWLLLLPFTLVNLAHWMLPAVRPGQRSRHAAAVAAAGLLRLLGLSLTLTLMLATAFVTMDLGAWQCASLPSCTAGLRAAAGGRGAGPGAPAGAGRAAAGAAGAAAVEARGAAAAPLHGAAAAVAGRAGRGPAAGRALVLDRGPLDGPAAGRPRGGLGGHPRRARTGRAHPLRHRHLAGARGHPAAVRRPAAARLRGGGVVQPAVRTRRVGRARGGPAARRAALAGAHPARGRPGRAGDRAGFLPGPADAPAAAARADPRGVRRPGAAHRRAGRLRRRPDAVAVRRGRRQARPARLRRPGHRGARLAAGRGVQRRSRAVRGAVPGDGGDDHGDRPPDGGRPSRAAGRRRRAVRAAGGGLPRGGPPGRAPGLRVGRARRGGRAGGRRGGGRSSCWPSSARPPAGWP